MGGVSPGLDNYLIVRDQGLLVDRRKLSRLGSMQLQMPIADSARSSRIFQRRASLRVLLCDGNY
jgi:hypothetical protein